MDAQLGRSISIHRGTFSAGGWLWYVGGIFILASFFNLRGGGGWAAALLCLVLGGTLLVVPVARWRQRLEVFEQGFVWRRLLGTKVLRREEVRGAELITHRGRAGTFQEVLIHLADGRELSVSGLEGGERLRNFLTAWARPQPSAGAMGWAPPGPQG